MQDVRTAIAGSLEAIQDPELRGAIQDALAAREAAAAASMLDAKGKAVAALDAILLAVVILAARLESR